MAGNLTIGRLQLGSDRVLMVPSPENGTVELRAGTAQTPGALIARFDGAIAGNLEVSEFGSNANGSYVRFSGGLQICTREAATVALSSTSSTILLPYPAAFSSVMFTWATPNADAAAWAANPDRVASIAASRFFDTNLTQFSGILSRADGVPFNGATGSIHYAAIGRWK